MSAVLFGGPYDGLATTAATSMEWAWISRSGSKVIFHESPTRAGMLYGFARRDQQVAVYTFEHFTRRYCASCRIVVGKKALCVGCGTCACGGHVQKGARCGQCRCA